MKLLIVESPAKAKTINKYLGKDFKVLASFGHIRDLPAKDGSVRPEDDFAMDYEVSSSSSKHVKAISDAMKQADELYLATDPDREGEAISWHLVEVLKQRRALKATIPVHRVVFNEITKKAVVYAVNNPRELDMDLVNAQQARRALDYLVGFNLSPVLWRKLPGSKSAGRVQSVALRLICEREEEIEQFTSREYWSIHLGVETPENAPFKAKLTHFDGKKLDQFDVTSEAAAAALVSALEKDKWHVASVEAKQVKRNPAPPFTTSSLQQEASRKLGFGAKRTMQIAQKLYEGVEVNGESVGLITYMRTDGVTVSEDAIAATRAHIKQAYGAPYVPDSARRYKTKAKNSQEAHEAIRPTDVNRTPQAMQSYLDKDQLRLYTLIWKRLVASQMAAAILDQVRVDISNESSLSIARATGSTIRFDGFITLYKEGKDDEQDEDDGYRLPPMQEKDALTLQDVTPEQHFTQPPPRYTEASLVKKLEELGIGRPSTYASIISVLQERDYVRIEKKRFVSEGRGRVVTAFLRSFFPRYVEYDFTADLEDQLDHISSGDLDWKKLLHQFWKVFHENVDQVMERTITEVITALNDLLAWYLFPHDEEGQPNRKCPSCDNGELSLKLGKFGAFVGCSNYPECNYTRQLGGDTAGQEKSAESGEGISSDVFSPRVVGHDGVSGLDVLVKKGPYGFYLQLGEDDKSKPKRLSLPKQYDPNAITLEQALLLLSLPREIGNHPETGKVIKAGIGRYGPYLQHDGKYTSLKEDDVLTIGINRAVTVIAENQKGGKSAEPLRVLGKHPSSNEDIAVYDGRYGPYVKHQKVNASLPKGTSVDAITLEEALALLEKQANKPKKSSARGRKKK